MPACVCVCMCMSVCVRVGFSFRCVGFRIYAFPILDDISYFCADSAAAAAKATADDDDDDAPLLLLLYGFCIHVCITYMRVPPSLHPPPSPLLHMRHFSVCLPWGLSTHCAAHLLMPFADLSRLPLLHLAAFIAFSR